MKVYTRADLDDAKCSDPGCSHANHEAARVLYINQTCHGGHGLDVSYDKDTGTLTAVCTVCESPVAQFQVAPGQSTH